jgi:hypothetical protein
MKTLIYTLLVLSICLLVFNTTLLNFDALLEGQSKIAVIGIMASLCSVLLLWILLVSKKIKEKTKQ